MSTGTGPRGAPSPILVAADVTAAEETSARLRDAGWTVTAPDQVPPEPWDLVGRALVVVVTADEAGMADVVLLAARGAGLVLVVDIEDPVIAEALLDQLGRIGPVRDAGVVGGSGAARRLSREEAAVLEALAEGASIPEAAARLFVSVRTANRRLASARAALGVDSTRAAVVAHMATRDRTGSGG